MALLPLSAAATQASEPLERVLFPVITPSEGVPGGFGSLWMTRMTGYNAADEPVVASQSAIFPCQTLCTPPPHTVPARSEFEPTVQGTNGGFVWIDRDNAHLISLYLRVQDVTRQSLTWGTEIPVVREGEFTDVPIQLLDVPVDERFRQTLRIYGFSADPSDVEVRVYSASGELLASRELRLASGREYASQQTIHPAYASIGWLLSEFPQLDSSIGEVRIEVVSTDGEKIWAFVSVTNNETQHVTTITP